MKNKKRLIIFFILFIILIFVSFYIFYAYVLKSLEEGEDPVVINLTTGYLIEDCASLGYINEGADYIVYGVVRNTESLWDEDRANIYTYTDLEIESYVKGEPFIDNNIRIISLGGQVEGIFQQVEAQVDFSVGDTVKIYFKGTDDGFQVVCGQFGVKKIETFESVDLRENYCMQDSDCIQYVLCGCNTREYVKRKIDELPEGMVIDECMHPANSYCVCENNECREVIDFL